MPKLDSRTIASKAVDIQKGLQEVSLSIPHYHFNKTLRVGKIVRLAANIQGLEIIQTLDRLEIMAIELGIDPDSLKTSILPSLEELNLVKTHKDHTGKIDRIEETVPSVLKLLDSTGKYWLEMLPTGIESAGIVSLHMTSTIPVPLTKLHEALPDLQENEFEILMDCGRSGRFLNDYQSTTGETIVYSPTIWGSRSEDVLKFYSRLDERGKSSVTRMAEQVKGFPGMPLELLSEDSKLVAETLGSGLLEKGSTVSRMGKTRDFLFFPTPQFKMKSSGLPDPFDKVKAIISCVRHGEHYAEISKILYPSLLLQRLLERGYLSPHSEAGDQYAILELYGVLKTEKFGDRWKPVLVQSEENKEALKTAIDIISTGEAITRKLVQEEARSLLVSGSFIDPIRNRARTKELPALSQASLKDMLERLRGER